MRLRSSQFVFFLLLACSVRVQEDYALRLMAGTALTAPQFREAAATPRFASGFDFATEAPALALELAPQAAAAHRAAWTMPHPASASASVISFSSLLRA